MLFRSLRENLPRRPWQWPRRSPCNTIHRCGTQWCADDWSHIRLPEAVARLFRSPGSEAERSQLIARPAFGFDFSRYDVIKLGFGLPGLDSAERLRAARHHALLGFDDETRPWLPLLHLIPVTQNLLHSVHGSNITFSFVVPWY